jgi:hypothetical protein
MKTSKAAFSWMKETLHFSFSAIIYLCTRFPIYLCSNFLSYGLPLAALIWISEGLLCWQMGGYANEFIDGQAKVKCEWADG